MISSSSSSTFIPSTPISLSHRTNWQCHRNNLLHRPSVYISHHRSIIYASTTQQTSLPEPLPIPSSLSNNHSNEDSQQVLPDLTLTSTSTTTTTNNNNNNNNNNSNDQSIHPPESLNKSIARIALPALGTLALDPLVALADMACVGHLGAKAIGGVGIGNNVFNLSFTCFNFLALATTPLIARAYAQNDKRQASKLIAQGLWIAFISGITATIFLSIYSIPILKFFGANEVILPYAIDYLRVRIIAAPFFLTAMVGNGTFRGFQDTKTPLFIGLFSNMLNLILYPTLIFAFKMGTKGAGIAMSTGQICTGIILLYLLVKTKKLLLSDMSLKNFPKFSSLLPLLKTGMILSVRTFSIYSTISYATATTSKMGTIQIASFEIGRQIFALFARLFDAISVAGQSLISLSIGQNNYQMARKISNRILGISCSMGFIFTCILMLIINLIPNLFTSNTLVINMVKVTFPFMAFIQPINGLVFVLDGIYTAGRKFSILSSVIFVSACIATWFLYVVRCANLPLQFVWIGLNIMMMIRALVLGCIYMTKWSPVPRKEYIKSEFDFSQDEQQQQQQQQHQDMIEQASISKSK